MARNKNKEKKQGQKQHQQQNIREKAYDEFVDLIEADITQFVPLYSYILEELDTGEISYITKENFDAFIEKYKKRNEVFLYIDDYVKTWPDSLELAIKVQREDNPRILYESRLNYSTIADMSAALVKAYEEQEQIKNAGTSVGTNPSGTDVVSGADAGSTITPGPVVAPAPLPGAGISLSTTGTGLLGASKSKLLTLLHDRGRMGFREALITSADLTDNPRAVRNKRLKDGIRDKYNNYNVPVYGFTTSIPEMLPLENAYLFNHYEAVINYYAMMGTYVPSKVYVSRVTIPIMHDGGFYTEPQLFSDKNKYNVANSLSIPCVTDSMYLPDYTVIDINKIVKIQFLDRRYEFAKIIGVVNYPAVLQSSLTNQFSDLGLVFNGSLGVVGSVGAYGTLGPNAGCPERYNPKKGMNCGNSGFKYADFPLLQQVGVKEGSICTTDDRAKNAQIIVEEIQKQIPGNIRNLAVGAIINSIAESGLNSGIVNQDKAKPGATGLFQLYPSGEGAGFMRDRTGIIATRKKELGLSGGPKEDDKKNPVLNAAYTVSRFLEIPEIKNATSPSDAVDKIIRKYEIPYTGSCMDSAANGRIDTIKYFFN
jgi:hypothetical protein